MRFCQWIVLPVETFQTGAAFRALACALTSLCGAVRAVRALAGESPSRSLPQGACPSSRTPCFPDSGGGFSDLQILFG